MLNDVWTWLFRKVYSDVYSTHKSFTIDTNVAFMSTLLGQQQEREQNCNQLSYLPYNLINKLRKTSNSKCYREACKKPTVHQVCQVYSLLNDNTSKSCCKLWLLLHRWHYLQQVLQTQRREITVQAAIRYPKISNNR